MFGSIFFSGSSKAVLATRASRGSARLDKTVIDRFGGELIRVVGDVVSRKCTTPQRHTEVSARGKVVGELLGTGSPRSNIWPMTSSRKSSSAPAVLGW